MSTTTHMPHIASFVSMLILSVTFALAGCSLFNSDDDGDSNEGVCTDVFNAYADTFYPEVTRTQCEATERGEWIDGRCYCHGVS